MRWFLPVLMFISVAANAQSKFKPRWVVADNNFNCSAYTFIDSRYGNSGSFLDTLYNITNICKSNNEIDIRFSSFYWPNPYFEISLLSFSGQKWSGKKFQITVDTLYYDSSLNASAGKVIVSRIREGETLDSLVRLLIKNDIFALPDLEEVKNKPREPKCGVVHSLTFKIGNEYRTYSFNNTAFYATHSDRPVFKKYDAIFKLLTTGLPID